MTLQKIVYVLGIALAAGCTARGGGGDDGGDDDDGGDHFDGCDGESPAHETFDAFWTVLDERFAVFDLRLTDTTWAEIGRAGCDRISAGMTDDELFDVLIEMARFLDDGHTNLTADNIGRDEDAEVSIYPHYEEVYGLEDLIETRYLDAAFTTAAEDEISWGTIGAIGYISITAMEELSASGDEDDDVAAAGVAMGQALSDLAGADGIVVDIRANEGGWDAVSLEIAAWFAGPRTIAWRERVRNGPDHDDFADPTDTYVDATRPGGYAGPVVILSSGGTYSAAETFELAIRVRDHVTILGERGSGHLSDQIEADLPNGWVLDYSGERYYAADGEVYEVVGIPVDVPMALDVAALAAGTDTMLEAALAQLR